MTDQEYQSIPVAVARAAVQASGELEGIEGPHFLSAQSVDWRPYFAPSADGITRPDFARVIITRKGQRPREVVISWDEYAEQMDADPEWDALRASKPMSIFGAEVERHAYRVVFADVLAEAMRPRIVGPAVNLADIEAVTRAGDRLMVVPDSRSAAGWDLPARDWLAEVKAADAVKLNALYDEAREAGALVKVDGLQLAFTNRMLDLATKPKPTPRPVAAPKGKPKQRRRRPRPDEAA